MFCLKDSICFVWGLLYSLAFPLVGPWVLFARATFTSFGAFKLEQLDREGEWMVCYCWILPSNTVLGSGVDIWLPSWTFSYRLLFCSHIICLSLWLTSYWRTTGFASVQPWASCGCESCLVTAGGQGCELDDFGSISCSLGGMVACFPRPLVIKHSTPFVHCFSCVQALISSPLACQGDALADV